MKRLTIAATSILLLGALDACASDNPASVFARYRQASGGDAWDRVMSLRSEGTLSAGGLNGEMTIVQDLVHGRSVDRYTLGPIKGADGYDGAIGWSQDPGGEVAVLDAPEAKRRARSEAWLDARAFWYPDRVGPSHGASSSSVSASYSAVASRDADGKRYATIEATPSGGDPLTLWFDAKSGLLARTVQREGQDTTTTVYDDYRDVAGVKLPFHVTSDRTDAAGRTDPRNRTEFTARTIAANVALADADFAVPKMAPTARIVDAGGITHVHFDLVNNHIYADGEIDGKKARFLVDTGGVNLLTPASAKKFGIATEGKLGGRGVGDEQVDMAMGHAKEVRLGGAVLDNPVFYVMDLGDLWNIEGVACDGLVGYEMFRRFGVTIDYERGELTLAEPAKFAPPSRASVVPFALDDRIPIIAATLDGAPIRISVDTGSRASLSMHSPFVREHDLVARYHAAPEAVVGWGAGGASRGRPARFGALVIGDQAIDGVAGDLYTGDKGAFANPDLSGNLGGGVLKRFTVAFDYAAKRMYLAPNANFGKADAFDRSGLFLLGASDAFVVVDVAPESAAEKAGLKTGDRIDSIDGKGMNSGRLAYWREQFRVRPAGSKIAIEYVRDRKRGAATLVLADRIPAR
jgi:hypothetical protein